MKINLVLLILLLGSQTVFGGGEYHDLEGSFSIGGELIGGDIEKGSSHLYLNIDGDAAKRLYDSLEVQEEMDICTNTLFKSKGHLICFKGGYCAFAINLETNKLELGTLC